VEPPLQLSETVAQQQVQVLVDTGCDDVLVIAALVKRADLLTYQKPSAHSVRLADGSVARSHTVARVPNACTRSGWTHDCSCVLGQAEHSVISGSSWQRTPAFSGLRFGVWHARHPQALVGTANEQRLVRCSSPPYIGFHDAVVVFS
jgi:hypothetical protein